MGGYYPVFLRLDGKNTVVLGGGPVAARKAAGLLRAGAQVTVVSPRLCPELAAMAGDGRVTHIARAYERSDLDGAALVIAATDDPAANEEACGLASAMGVPSNSVRPPSAGSFIVPSTINRGSLTVAISTAGACLALAKKLRKELEGLIGEEYGPFMEFLENARDELKNRVAREADRAGILTKLVESGLVERFRGETAESASRAGRAMLDELVNALKN